MNVEENRRRFINDLRTNPLGLTQYMDGSLYDWFDDNAVCALGLGCKTFGIDMKTEYEFNPALGRWTSPYIELGITLGLIKEESITSDPESDVIEDELDRIWLWNDSYGYSFSEIADKCEQWWFGNE